MLGKRPIGISGTKKRGEEEGILKQLWDNYRGVRRGEEEDLEGEEELRKRTVRKISEQSGMSC